VTTDAVKEWVAAAGVWTPQDRRHALPILYKDDPNTGFALPPETKNIDDPAQRRRMVALDEFIGGPDGLALQRTDVVILSGEEDSAGAVAPGLLEKRRASGNEEARRPILQTLTESPDLTPTGGEREEDRLRQEEDLLSPEERSRRLVHKAGLKDYEVLALRLWSGPMFVKYNGVLRVGLKAKYTTTLHALVSAIIKLARIGNPEVVYRGLSGRAMTANDFGNGLFVEKGAQSFTRDLDVARRYSRSSDPEATAASYVLEVQEGHADQVRVPSLTHARIRTHISKRACTGRAPTSRASATIPSRRRSSTAHWC